MLDMWRLERTLNISSSVGVTYQTSAGPPMTKNAPLLGRYSCSLVALMRFDIPGDGLDVRSH
jgi:hypothetical protein